MEKSAVPMRILLIEDNPDHAEMILGAARAAYKDNLKSIWEKTFYNGIDRLYTDPFDVLLCDLNLPDSVMAETVAHLAALDTEVPIIVLTSFRDESSASWLIGQGIQDYLPKNQVDSEVFLRSINYAIERKKNSAQIERARKDQLAISLLLNQQIRKPIRHIEYSIKSLQEKYANVNLLDKQDVMTFESIDAHLKQLKLTSEDCFYYLSLQDLAEQPVECNLDHVLNMACQQVENNNVGIKINKEGELGTGNGIDTLLAEMLNRVFVFIADYGGNNSEVCISANCNDNGKIIKIIDNNQPMNTQTHLRLFEPFGLHHNDDEHQGSGLDLSIVKRILDIHKGWIKVQPKQDAGNCFTVFLPSGNDATFGKKAS